MTQDEINKKRDQIIKFTKYGGLALAAVILAPFLFFTTLFLFGSVVAAGAAGLLAIFFVNYLPVFGMKMANWKLKALKAEARLNPIETMQNQILQAADRLEVYKRETATFIAKAKALEEDTAEMRKSDPEGADSFNDVIKANAQQMVMRQKAISDAVEALATAENKLVKARKRWDMSKKHASLLNPTESEAVLDKILVDEAMEAVMEQANKSVSNLIVEGMVSEARANFKDKRNRENDEYRAKQAQLAKTEASGKPLAIDLDIVDASVVERKN